MRFGAAALRPGVRMRLSHCPSPDAARVDANAALGRRYTRRRSLPWQFSLRWPKPCRRYMDALAGDGRPAGILACRAIPNGVVVEWDPSVSGARLVTSLVDAELRTLRLRPHQRGALAASPRGRNGDRRRGIAGASKSFRNASWSCRSEAIVFSTIGHYVGISDVVDVIATSILIYYVLLLDSRDARRADTDRNSRHRRLAWLGESLPTAALGDDPAA